MNPPKVETGLVGFFDILGYKSFLEAGITDVTFKVIEILRSLPAKVEVAVKSHLGLDDGTIEQARKDGASAPFEQMLREISRIVPLVVSDSILLRCSYGEEDGAQKAAQAATFVVYANVLQRLMFEAGLPLRGAIAFGDFVFVDHVFAGKPIVDAHTLGQSLDLAACAIHETAENEFNSLLALAPEQGKDFLSESLSLVRYQTPIRRIKTEDVRAEQNLLLLNLAWPTLSSSFKNLPDISTYIRDRFLANGKTLGPSAVPKLENTKRFILSLASRFPILFGR
jgi:hypothetical protein